MTQEKWQTNVRAVGAIPNCPSWLKHQSQLSWKAISQLPVVDQKAVASDYLSFLREQIELGTRGPEWSDVQRKRLTALEPFVGMQLIVAVLYSKPLSATLRIDPQTKALVHVKVN